MTSEVIMTSRLIQNENYVRRKSRILLFPCHENDCYSGSLIDWRRAFQRIPFHHQHFKRRKIWNSRLEWFKIAKSQEFSCILLTNPMSQHSGLPAKIGVVSTFAPRAGTCRYVKLKFLVVKIKKKNRRRNKCRGGFSLFPHLRVTNFPDFESSKNLGACIFFCLTDLTWQTKYKVKKDFQK